MLAEQVCDCGMSVSEFLGWSLLVGFVVACVVGWFAGRTRYKRQVGR